MVKGPVAWPSTILTVPGCWNKSFSLGFYQDGLFQPSLTQKTMSLLALNPCRTII